MCIETAFLRDFACLCPFGKEVMDSVLPETNVDVNKMRVVAIPQVFSLRTGFMTDGFFHFSEELSEAVLALLASGMADFNVSSAVEGEKVESITRKKSWPRPGDSLKVMTLRKL